ncbi:unnamed protein product [Polarella glacialis]|uniref:Uncharacterized protein n=1 Tax=Polarella glacialis TaxID=89957 RepID=A0A813FB04_POLGL|nr:unnamed protein product [Polarella glacialis]
MFVVIARLVAAGPKPRSENAETEPSLAREVLNEVLGFASPDETYFHTLAVNSEHCTAHIRYNFHFHDTQGNFLDEASQLYTDFPTGSPPALVASHLPLLLQVRSLHPLVFARKFDASNASSTQFLRSSVLQLAKAARPSWAPLTGHLVLAGHAVFDLAPATYALRLGRLARGCLLRQRRDVAVGDKTAQQQQPQQQPQQQQQKNQQQQQYRLAALGRRAERPAPARANNNNINNNNSNNINNNNKSLRPIALRAHSGAKGVLLLTELYAVPGLKGASTGSPPAAAEKSPLAWLRVGSGWDAAQLRFSGACSVVDAEEASREGLFAVLHWHAASVRRKLTIRWVGPGGAELQSEEVPEWQLLSGIRAPLPAQGFEPGWWSLEVVQLEMHQGAPLEGGAHRGQRRGQTMLGQRRFFLFGPDTPPDAAVFQDLFSFDAQQVESASSLL